MTPAWSDILVPGARLLVLAPHPDDDVLGCSRLMQRAVDARCEVIVVWLTDGGASHGSLSPARRAALVARRRDEALAGLRALAVAPLTTHFMGYRDGELTATVADAIGKIATMCRRYAVGTVAVTDQHDDHPDHRAAYSIAAAANPPYLLGYPVSGGYDGGARPAPPGALRIAPGPRDAKRLALSQHCSQMEDAATYPMTPATIDRFCSEDEIFIPAMGPFHAA